MSESRLRKDVHRALDPLARPVPWLLSRSMAAVRTKRAEPGERLSGFRYLAGAAALLLAVVLLGTVVLRNVALPVPGARPTENGVWSEDLTLTGELNARAATTVHASGSVRSSCTGKYGRNVRSYQLTLALNTDHGVLRVDVYVEPYVGPGTYTTDTGPEGKPRAARAAVFDVAGSRGWASAPEDSVSFTVDSSEEAGTIKAALTVLDDRASTPETVTGTWSCRTSP